MGSKVVCMSIFTGNFENRVRSPKAPLYYIVSRRTSDVSVHYSKNTPFNSMILWFWEMSMNPKTIILDFGPTESQHNSRKTKHCFGKSQFLKSANFGNQQLKPSVWCRGCLAGFCFPKKSTYPPGFLLGYYQPQKLQTKVSQELLIQSFKNFESQPPIPLSPPQYRFPPLHQLPPCWGWSVGRPLRSVEIDVKQF